MIGHENFSSFNEQAGHGPEQAEPIAPATLTVDIGRHLHLPPGPLGVPLKELNIPCGH
jgi:hypothetical protein